MDLRIWHRPLDLAIWERTLWMGKHKILTLNLSPTTAVIHYLSTIAVHVLLEKALPNGARFYLRTLLVEAFCIPIPNPKVVTIDTSVTP